MNDETPTPDAQNATDAAPETPETAAAVELSAEEKLQAQIADMENQVAALQQKIGLGLADYQNLARRARISEQQARDGQTRTIAMSLASVLDHFDQALKIDPAKASAADVLAGVSMVHSELVKALASFGVSRIEAKPGDAFDANAHQALMKQKVEGMEKDQIALCLQTGYRLGEMIIRPAQVAVTE